jgi:hypothetical protein
MNNSNELLESARSAYERGRVAKALRTAALVVPMMLLSFGCCGSQVAALAIGAVLAAAVTVLVWRGGVAGRAVLPGLLAGAVPLAFPLLACPACQRAGWVGAASLGACVVGGLASGAIVAAYTLRVREDRAVFLVTAGGVAAVAGSLGCVIVGMGGVVAMAIGLMLAAPLGLRAPGMAR